MMPSLFSVINGVFFIRAAAGGGRRARLRMPGRRNKSAGHDRRYVYSMGRIACRAAMKPA